MPRIPEDKKLTPQEIAKKRGFRDGYRDGEYDTYLQSRADGEYPEYYVGYYAGFETAEAENEIEAQEAEEYDKWARAERWLIRDWERDWI